MNNNVILNKKVVKTNIVFNSAGHYNTGGKYMMGYGGYGYGMMGFGWGFLMMIVILVAVIFSIIALVRFLQRTSPNPSSNIGNKAMEILNERYARGEISDEEYKRKKAELKT